MTQRLIVPSSSFDMTLALAAESYLRVRANPKTEVADPVGGQSLSDLIDLVINSEICFMTLPSDAAYEAQPILVQRLYAILAIRWMPRAAVTLRDDVEEQVAKAFWPLVDTLGKDWLSRWWKSHFSNPVVRRHYLPRLGEQATTFDTMSDDGWEYWQKYLKSRAPADPFAPFNQRWLREDISRAGGLAAYQYCYTYDVFRRGWQYAQAARLWPDAGGIKYCPHQLRRAALEAGSDGWLEAARDKCWSWGRYIVRVVDSSSQPVEPGQIADWVAGLRAAGVPRWVSVSRRSADLVGRLEEAARKARIPRLQIEAPSSRLKMASGVTELLKSTLPLSVELPLTAVETVISVLPANKVLDAAKFRVNELGKSVANQFQRARFGYPGLVGRHDRRKSARKDRLSRMRGDIPGDIAS